MANFLAKRPLFVEKNRDFRRKSFSLLKTKKIVLAHKLKTMTVKRALFPKAAAPLAKRVKTLEYKVAARTPETKMQILSFSGTIADGAAQVLEFTAVAEGTGANERLGNKIRILRIETRGDLGADNVDMYFIQCHTTTAPAYANFASYQGGHITIDSTNTRFTEWNYTNGRKFSDNAGMRRVFTLGMNSKFNGSASTSCVDNRLFVVVKNDTGSTQTCEFVGRMWFTDA